MQYTFLQKQGCKVSKLALGTKIFVDKIKVNDRMYKHTLVDSPKDIITRAIDAGVNVIESTSFYPDSALSGLSTYIHNIKKSLILNCRIGYRVDRNNEVIREQGRPKGFLTKRYIVEDVEKLLKIFRTDYLDVVTICGLDKNKKYVSDVFDAFVTMKRRGYVRFSGVYLLQPDSNEVLSLIKDSDFCQLTYNVLNQEFDQHLSEIAKTVHIISCAPFANGVLSRKYTDIKFFKDSDPRTIFYTKEKLKQYRNYMDELHFLEIKKEQTQPLKKSRNFIQGALNFVLQNPNIATTIFCVNGLKQLDDVLGVFDSEELTQPQMELIKSLYTEKAISN